MATTVDILFECASDLSTKEVFSFAGTVETPISAVIKQHNGYLLKFKSLEAALKFRDNANKTGEGFKAGFMRNTWDRYTLRVRRVPDAWKDYEDAEILDNLREKYGSEVQPIYYDRTGRWAKITIFDEGVLKKILTEGLVSLGSITDSFGVERYIPINVRVCYKCFGYDHLSYDCEKPQRCTRCGENHAVADCKASTQKCCHCGGPHSPLAFRCQSRKAFIAKKIREIKDGKGPTGSVLRTTGAGRSPETPPMAPPQIRGSYAQAAKQNVPIQPPIHIASRTHTFAAAPAHHDEEEIRLLSKLIPNMAFIMSDGTEGSFLRKTNELLVLNGFRGMPFLEEHLNRKDKLLTEKEREKATARESSEETGKSSDDEDVQVVSSCESVERKKQRKKKGKPRTHTQSQAAASDSEDAVEEPAPEVEGTKEPAATVDPQPGSSTHKHTIQITYPQFRNIVLETWSKTKGIAGRFCPGINKKLRRLGLDPLVFPEPWNDVACKEVFPNDEALFESLYRSIMPRRSERDPGEEAPLPAPTPPHFTRSKRKT